MTTTVLPRPVPNLWIIRAAAQRVPRVKLFCLPHAGGTAALFRSWRNALPLDVELCAIQLPGRLSHFKTPAFNRMGPLADALTQVISADAGTQPFALFGHCNGALLAYEVAQRLCARGQTPVHLFVACSRAPHLPDPHSPVHQLPDGALVAALRAMGGTPPEVLDNPGMLRVLLPLLRADFEAAETYRHVSEPLLPFDVTAMGGQRDDLVSRGELESWGALFSGRLTTQLFPGGHFLLDTAESLVIATIAAALASPEAAEAVG
jgi:surfactin synthase thioesterase subunit